jgi:NADH-ubiquinone oxidoreductase chain 6
MTLSSWYAFLIFLIYVGGILVIFAYFTATSPNQQQISSKQIIKTTLIALFVTGLAILYTNKTIPLTPTKSHQLIRLYTSHNIYTLILITLILLITMVIVVKLSSRSKGPLRTFIT